MITLNRMLLSPEGADAGVPGGGGTGVPAAPPPASTPSPAPSPAPRLPFNPPSGDGAPSPRPAGTPGQGAPGGAPGGGPPAPGAQDNPIPYSRVREMVERARAETREQALREMQARGMGDLSMEQRLKMARGVLSMLGIETPEEQPQMVTRADLEHMLAERDQRYEQRSAIQQEYEQGKRDLDTARAQYADAFAAYPGLDEHVTALYAQNPGKSMGEIVKETVERLEGYYAQRSKAYVQGKQNSQRTMPVRPSAAPGGVPGGRPQIDLSTDEGQDQALDTLLDEIEG